MKTTSSMKTTSKRPKQSNIPNQAYQTKCTSLMFKFALSLTQLSPSLSLHYYHCCFYHFFSSLLFVCMFLTSLVHLTAGWEPSTQRGSDGGDQVPARHVAPDGPDTML